LPGHVLSIAGLGAAPTKKAGRLSAGRLLEREPAGEGKRATACGCAEQHDQTKAGLQQRNDRAAVRRSAEAAARCADGGRTCQSVAATGAPAVGIAMAIG